MFILLSVLQSEPYGVPTGHGQLDISEPLSDSKVNLSEAVRVLCWVMTTPANHASKAVHVKRTWGRRCNKLLLMSSAEDKELGTIALPVGEGREGLWNKSREAFRYAYEHHLEEYDWFLKADDDTYVILENLRYFLYPFSPEFPIYFGSKFRYPEYVKQGYFSGGAGYVLSREALKRFVEQALQGSKNCTTAFDTEDLEMGRCMESVNVTAGDSRDLLGRKRFLPLEPMFHLTTNPADDPNFWYNYYSFYEPFYGDNCCSDLAISFHYIPGQQMHVMDYLIYGLHPYGVKFRNPPLKPKLSWDEARLVPGPYPVETTTVNATVDLSSTVSASSEESSSSQANIDTRSENSTSSEASNEVGSTSNSSYLLEIFKRLLEKQEINKTKEEEIIDKILSDKEFTKKLLDKLKLRQNE
ncbi:glycoprotein-N-acetylgalactosamine 3-beta-galactosyltransferase 1-like isoform X2 [Culex pipiens pallens]|nr:glycoprotein-N-acetylgalactosamine 3-beta-galactosyltransferase 1-like isoform X2 [Culex pipiens pallens]